jgi:hypothetical protein
MVEAVRNGIRYLVGSIRPRLDDTTVSFVFRYNTAAVLLFEQSRFLFGFRD